MADVLAYWRDYENHEDGREAGSGWRWHSSAGCMAELKPGDRMWVVTSGQVLGREPKPAAFLVGVWTVRQVAPNPDDDPVYPAAQYRNRVEADPSGSVMLAEPVVVDHILRPAGRERAVSIGRFLQGPRRLSDEKKRQLQAAAGGELAAAYLRKKR